VNADNGEITTLQAADIKKKVIMFKHWENGYLHKGIRRYAPLMGQISG
jgi:hypothetical protein